MAGFTARQQGIWQALNDIIHSEGARVVSMPNTTPMIFECQDADLPLHLSRLGYEVRGIDTVSRLRPFQETIRRGGSTQTITHVRPMDVFVYELDIEAPPPTDRIHD